jgi:hypothetical protein
MCFFSSVTHVICYEVAPNNPIPFINSSWQQSLLSLATIAKLVDNQQTFSCTLFWPVASPSSTATLVSCASCFSVLYSSYLASGLFVLNVFTLCSQKVPQGVPNSISILYHILWPQFNFHVYKKKGGRAK